MKSSADERDAYVQAEVATALAHQIRAIRLQRGWSQAQLAQRMGTKQHVVSRLEDPSYGRCSMQTLFLLSRAFDTGLQVRFVSFVTMLKDTFKPRHAEREVLSFEGEAHTVGFYTNAPRNDALFNVTVVTAKSESLQAGAVYERISPPSFDRLVWSTVTTVKVHQ
jgi:transcriptional regulator with XRE-family HTH domain